MSEDLRNDPDVQTWSGILDRFEAALTEAEALVDKGLECPLSEWAVPQSAPLLPETLVGRTLDLLSRQTAMVQRLEATGVLTRRHIQYLRLDAAKGIGGGPRFVDQRA